jgi:hypothetical protein
MSQATQPAPPVPTYGSYPEGYPAKFVRYHTKYPQVYAGIVRRARELKVRGFRDVGLRYCFEDLRYSQEAPPPGVETAWLYALDNNLCPWYGRLIDANEPDLKGFFRLRRTEDEIYLAEVAAGQLDMEFE